MTVGHVRLREIYVDVSEFIRPDVTISAQAVLTCEPAALAIFAAYEPDTPPFVERQQKRHTSRFRVGSMMRKSSPGDPALWILLATATIRFRDSDSDVRAALWSHLFFQFDVPIRERQVVPPGRRHGPHAERDT